MFQIDDKTKSKIEKLAKKYRLSLVVLFGSQATGKTHSRSDVDMAFLSEAVMDLNDIVKMQMEFSKELRIKNLEMVAMNGAHPLLLKQVARKSLLLYEKERSMFARFKIYALKRFMEAQKLFDLRKLSFNKFLQKT